MIGSSLLAVGSIITQDFRNKRDEIVIRTAAEERKKWPAMRKGIPSKPPQKRNHVFLL